MARKRRRKSQAQPPPPPEREVRFHAPFQDLKTSLRKASSSPAAPAPPASAPAPPGAAQLQAQQAEKARQAAVQREAAQRQQREEEQDQAAFRVAMSDVQRLPSDPRGQVDQTHRVGPISGLPSDDEASLNELRDLVEGRSVFTLQFTDEYMEGVAQDVDQRLAQRLHQGDFAIQAQLDLHGYFVEDAKQQVDQFLTTAYTTGQRCLRLIHGRGRNSPDNRPVLKEHVQLWLSHGRLSRMVLAFATAPAHDGGAGATYVLLRRSASKRHK
jgi:DNA-nicking Smr family endonuclease